MKNFLPRVTALTVGTLLTLSSFSTTGRAQGYEEHAETILEDVLVWRPAGVVLTVGGAGLFALIYPATLISGGTRDCARTLVKTPFNFTFRRPIGTDLRD